MVDDVSTKREAVPVEEDRRPPGRLSRPPRQRRTTLRTCINPTWMLPQYLAPQTPQEAAPVECIHDDPRRRLLTVQPVVAVESEYDETTNSDPSTDKEP